MKKLMILFTALLLSAFQLNAFIPDGDEGDPEEIDLTVQQGGDDPTSLNTCTIHAYKTNSSVLITISNYFGNLSAVIFGSSGNLFGHKSISGSGILSIDISAMAQGDCTLVIQVDHSYIGYFTIK